MISFKGDYKIKLFSDRDNLITNRCQKMILESFNYLNDMIAGKVYQIPLAVFAYILNPFNIHIYYYRIKALKIEVKIKKEKLKKLK